MSSSKSRSVSTRQSDRRSAGTGTGRQNIDRWTHNINYQQLVASASIGLVQFWRFPYLAQTHSGWSTILIYMLFTIIFGYPMHYLELAIGMVTRKSSIKCWDLAPMGRGFTGFYSVLLVCIGWAMLLISVYTAFSLSILCAYSLAMFVHSFHTFLPWLNCAANTVVPCTQRHTPKIGSGHESPSESYFHHDILHINRKGINDGLGIILWELTVYYLISWLFIYFIVIKGIYSYSKIVLFTAVIAFFVLFVSTAAIIFLKGSFDYIRFDAEWDKLKHIEVYRVMAEQVLMEMAVSQGTLTMLGSYNTDTRMLNLTSLMSVAISKLVTITSMIILSKVGGSMNTDSGIKSNSIDMAKGPAVPIVLWAELTVRIPGNQFWSAVVFFTFFSLSVSTVALLIQTILSNVRGGSVKKARWIITIITCLIFCLVGVVTLCTQGGIYLLGFLDFWPVSMPRLPVAALTAAIITCIYGQKSFCEDVYFAVEEYPNVFLRVCWAIDPIILMVLFVSGCLLYTPPVVYGHMFPSDVTTVGLALVLITLLPIGVMVVFYLIFRWRIRNIVDSEK